MMSSKPVRELTFNALALGVLLSVVMCAANTYLGLYAGMTVSASIPAAVISMGLLRGVLRKGSILENNIVQTMASAGESLAAGIIFTVPALVLTGIWNRFEFWPTTLIAVCGGLLGIVFMIPLRKALIVEEKTLTYPEGVACAAVLEAGETGSSGLKGILRGMLIGGVFKFFTTGFGLLKGTVETAWRWGDRIFFTGLDASPALLAVGYIVDIEIASLVFAGGFIGWNIILPLLALPAGGASGASEAAWTLWSQKVRYVGVGAMVVGGVWSIVQVRSGIARGVSGLFRQNRPEDGAPPERTRRDVPPVVAGIILAATIVLVFTLYNHLTDQIGLSVATTLIMVVAAFFFVAVSSYIVGLVGSSNNPVSGMTICVLLATSALLLVFGMKGENAMLATLGVAGVVCCAACSAGDMSQDLKTGYLVGATPAAQQIAQIIGVAVPAFVIAPILTLLHTAYGIGTGLKAPQATLFASITKGMFGSGNLPWNMIVVGVLLGIAIISGDLMLKQRGSRFRLHVMPVAVGVYLPVTLAVPMLIGGLIRRLASHTGESESPSGQDTGILVSSGLIAGEAVAGILIALIIYLNWNINIPIPQGFDTFLSSAVTISAMAGVGVFLHRSRSR